MTAAIPSALLIHTVTWKVYGSSSTDSYGNAVPTYSAGTSIAGRVEQDKATDQRSDGRSAAVRNWTLFTNQDGIKTHDLIVFGSLTFEVDGPPAPVYGGAAFHHAEVALRLVEG